jgi:hypothetical protein
MTAVTSTLVSLATGTVAQTVPPTLPAAIICYAQADQSWRVGYLYRVSKNGDATYIAPGGRLDAVVNAKGVVVPPTNRPSGIDCFGKTLDELRSNGRIMDFQRTKWEFVFLLLLKREDVFSSLASTDSVRFATNWLFRSRRETLSARSRLWGLAIEPRLDDKKTHHSANASRTVSSSAIPITSGLRSP